MFLFSSLIGNFDTIAVPNILVFHNTKMVAKFNSTARTLEAMVHLVSNVTGQLYHDMTCCLLL